MSRGESMHPLTQKLVSELDLLYGLYQMAVDLAKRIKPDDEEGIGRMLEARRKILERTGTASQEVIGLLQSYKSERLIPANEKALVEEKRNLILDLAVKIQAADHQAVRAMLAKLASIRKELAGQTELKNAAKAYIQAPLPQLLTK